MADYGAASMGGGGGHGEDMSLMSGKSEKMASFDVESDEGGGRLGTFFGVFVPCVSSMFGVVCFLRMSTIVGHAGFWGTICIIGVAFLISFLSVLSLCALITHGKILLHTRLLLGM